MLLLYRETKATITNYSDPSDNIIQGPETQLPAVFLIKVPHDH